MELLDYQLNPSSFEFTAGTAPVIRREKVPAWSHHHERNRQARRVMARRISRNPKHCCHRLNGSHIVSFRMPEEITLFTGSSLNRKKDADKKTVKKRAKKVLPSLFETPDAEQLCSYETSGPGDTGELAGSADLSTQSLRMLSARTKSKVKAKCSAFFRVYGKKATFCTLSFIQSVSDSRAVKILNKFLTVMREEIAELGGILNYLWVAERQTKNKKFPDNIHFHLLFNRRMDIQRCNDLWVMQQYNEGLVGWSIDHGNREVSKFEIEQLYRRTAELKRELEVCHAANDWKRCKQLRKLIEEHKIQRIFNPFDIKQVHDLDGLGHYLTKYITKNKGQFDCAAWHCSRRFSLAFTSAAVGSDALNDVHNNEINFSVDRRTGEMFFPQPLRNEGRYNQAQSHYTLMFVMNKEHFVRYLLVMDAINRWIFQEGFIPDLVKMSPEEYISKIFKGEKPLCQN